MAWHAQADCGPRSLGGDGSALLIKELLEGLGYTVFLDEHGIDGGQPWWALGTCRPLLVLKQRWLLPQAEFLHACLLPAASLDPPAWWQCWWCSCGAHMAALLRQGMK